MENTFWHLLNRRPDIINRLLQQSENERVGESNAKALEYTFTSVPEYMAILESLGYECYKEDGDIVIKRAGMIQEKVSLVFPVIK